MATVAHSIRPAAGARRPAGPRGLAVLPSAVRLLRDPLWELSASVRRYGDVVRFPLAHRTFLLVAAPAYVQHVLQDHADRYSKQTRSYRKLASVLGNGLLTSDGACWRRQRRQLQPAFHRGRLARLDAVITSRTLAMLRQWEALAEQGQPLDAAQAMTRLALSIVGRALLGTTQADRAAALEQAVADVLSGLYRRIEQPIDVVALLPTPAGRRHARALRRLDELIAAIIAERRTTSPEREDLLSHLVDEAGGGEPDVREVRDQIMTFLLAGHETTASALSWTLYLLATHPRCAERLRAELSGVLGGRVPTSDDLERLPYTRQVVLEAMRLYPPVWLIERRAEVPDVLGEVAVPEGATVALSQYVTHRDARWWREPERFEPERFEAHRARARPRYAYFPFGGAARHCIGDHFALMEARLVLAMLWQRVDVRLVSGHTVRPRVGITLRPDQLWIKPSKL